MLLTAVTALSHRELLALLSVAQNGSKISNIDLILISMKHKQEFTSPTVSEGEF